jgi:hypothetical protein
MVEPRSDFVKSIEEKIDDLLQRAEHARTTPDDWISLTSFRQELGGKEGTVLLSAGAYNSDNPFEIVQRGDVDAVVYGR